MVSPTIDNKIDIIKWSPNSNNMNLTPQVDEGGAASIIFADITKIYSAQFYYYNYNYVDYLFILMSVETPTSTYDVSYYKIIFNGNYPTIVKDTQYPITFHSYGTNNNTQVTYLRIVGLWVFYCTENPNACYSWSFNKPTFFDNNSPSDGTHYFKLETTSSFDNSIVKWNIINMSFFEKDIDAEIMPLIFYYDMTSSNNKIQGAYFILNSNETCFFFTKTTSYNYSNKICSLACYRNQIYDYTSATRHICNYCADGEYVSKNQCTTTCASTAVPLGFCDDGHPHYVINRDYMFETNYEINIVLGTDQKWDNSCDYNKMRINNSLTCRHCDAKYVLALQNYQCEKYCYKGYSYDPYNYICKNESCPTGKVYELGFCVDYCSVNGYLLNLAGDECVQCDSGKYELNNQECVDQSDCNEDYLTYYDSSNTQAFNAKYCVGCQSVNKIYEDGTCKDQCEILGNGPDIRSDYCTPCESGKFGYQGACLNSCPTDFSVLINYSNSNANYCADCIVVEDNQCKNACETEGYAPSWNRICGPCENGAYYNMVNNSCDYCQYTSYLVNEINSTTLARTCRECTLPQHVENNACVADCSSNKFPDSNNECKYCSGSLPYLNSSGTSCVSSCDSGESPINYTGYDKCEIAIGGPITCTSLEYKYLTICVTSCPSGYYKDNQNKECVTECPLGYKIYGEECVLNTVNTCPIETPYYYNSNCLNECPENLYIDNDNKCTGICTGNYLYYYENKCVQNCPIGYFIYNKICVASCPEYQAYVYNLNCFSTCPSGLFADSSKNCVLNCSNNESYTYKGSCLNKCPEGTYINNKECVDECPESASFIYNNTCLSGCPNGFYKYQNKCVTSCPNNSKYIYKNQCNDSCPEYYDKIINDKCFYNEDYNMVNNSTISCPSNQTSNTIGECVECYLSDFSYILDDECVRDCDNNVYRIVESGNDKVCVYNKSDTKICPDFCNSNGDCFLNVDGNGDCNCYEDFYGTACNLTISELDEYNTRLNSKYNNLLVKSTKNNELLLDDIKEIESIISIADDLLTDKLMKDLVSICLKKIIECLISNCIPDSELFELIDDTLYIKEEGNSTVDTTGIIEGLKNLTNNLFNDDQTITEQMEKLNSSIIYIGKTFSIQVSDNTVRDLTEARENDLPIVDYSECISSLKASGLLSNESHIYTINTNIDFGVYYSSLSSNIISASSVSNTVLVDDNTTTIDTSSCSSFIVKTPVNAESTGYDDYLDVISQVGVDIYNKSSEFFNDMCFKFMSYNSTDITVTSRREKYNLTAVCSDSCSYLGIDEHGYFQCNCTDTTNTVKSIGQYFEDSIFDNLLDNNIMLVLCFKEAFDSNTITDNIGFWVLTLGTLVSISLFLIIKYGFKNHTIEKHMEQLLSNDCEYGINIPMSVGNTNNKNRKAPNNTNNHSSSNSNTNRYLNDNTNNNDYFVNKNKLFNHQNYRSINTTHSNTNTNNTIDIYNTINNNKNLFTDNNCILPPNMRLQSQSSFKQIISPNNNNGYEDQDKNEVDALNTLYSTKSNISNIRPYYNNNLFIIKETKEKNQTGNLTSINTNTANFKKEDYNNAFKNSNDLSYSKSTKVSKSKSTSKTDTLNSINCFKILDIDTLDISKNSNDDYVASPRQYEYSKNNHRKSHFTSNTDNIINSETPEEFIAKQLESASNEVKEDINSKNDTKNIKFFDIENSFNNMYFVTSNSYINECKNANNLQKLSINELIIEDIDENKLHKNNNNLNTDNIDNNMNIIPYKYIKQQDNNYLNYTPKYVGKSDQEEGNAINTNININSTNNNNNNIETNDINTNINTKNKYNITDNNEQEGENLRIAKVSSYRNNSIEDPQEEYNEILEMQSKESRKTVIKLFNNESNKELNSTNTKSFKTDITRAYISTDKLKTYNNAKEKDDYIKKQSNNYIDNTSQHNQLNSRKISSKLLVMNSAENYEANTQNYNNNLDHPEINGNCNDNGNKLLNSRIPLYRKTKQFFDANNNTLTNTANSNNNLVLLDNELNTKKLNKNTKHDDNGNNIENNKKSEVKFDYEHKEFDEFIKNLKQKDISSERDLAKLPMAIQVRIDERSIWKFFWENLLVDHEILNMFFVKSLINPVWLRFITAFFQISMDFTLNAIFFTSDYINNQADIKAKEGADAIGFWYTIVNEFWKSFWPVVISLLIMQLVYIIVIIPDKYLRELNDYLLTKNKSQIILG